MPITLTTAEQLQIRTAAERLKRRFDGTLNTETIERFMNESLDTLVQHGNTSTWIPATRRTVRPGPSPCPGQTRVRSEPPSTPASSSSAFTMPDAPRWPPGGCVDLAGDDVDVFSGGSEPADQVNQAASSRHGRDGESTSAERSPNHGPTR